MMSHWMNGYLQNILLCFFLIRLCWPAVDNWLRIPYRTYWPRKIFGCKSWVESTSGNAVRNSATVGIRLQGQIGETLTIYAWYLLYKIALILRAFWLARLACWMRELSRLWFSPAKYFINEIYNLFPFNIASSKHPYRCRHSVVEFPVHLLGLGRSPFANSALHSVSFISSKQNWR